jgi:hypothetical protein
VHKSLILAIIDALSSWVVRPAVEAGRLPNLAALIQHGQVNWDCTSVMPSITPAATASLATGVYPCEHKIMGAYYYDREADRVAYFSDDVLAILNHRVSNFLQRFLYSLNHTLLDAETIYERLERAGITCAAVNYLIFRGEVDHTAHIPWLLRLWPGVPRRMQVQGPATLCLGDFVSERVGWTGEPPELTAQGGFFRRYGFNDATTAQYVTQLAQQGLPDFTLAYFPDNDYASHKVGPLAPWEPSRNLTNFSESSPTNGAAYRRCWTRLHFVVTGDHSQSETTDDQNRAGINLNGVFDDYQVVETGKTWQPGDQLMICPNLRAAQIYLRTEAHILPQEIVSRLLAEPRIDQVFLHRSTDGDVAHEFTVVTADRGRLDFWPATDEVSNVTDVFGNRWQIRGSLTAIDASVDDQNRITYGDYPNALERIASSFDDRRTGTLWVTAKPNCRKRASTEEVPTDVAPS